MCKSIVGKIFIWCNNIVMLSSLFIQRLCCRLAPYTKWITGTLEKRVLATLWLLGNQESYRGVADRFNISKGSLHSYFLAVCTGLQKIGTEIIIFPTREQQKSCADFIHEKTGFPGVVGACDGTYVKITAPSQPFRECYINRKGDASMNVMAVCDHKLRFIYVFAGHAGSVHDARVFSESPLKDSLQSGSLHHAYHILADSAYRNESYYIVPFRDNGHLSNSQFFLNSVHRSARVMIERAFGILKCKWRRLKFLDMTLLSEIPIVIYAAFVLHNFWLMIKDPDEQELCDSLDDSDMNVCSVNVCEEADSLIENRSSNAKLVMICNYISPRKG